MSGRQILANRCACGAAIDIRAKRCPPCRQQHLLVRQREKSAAYRALNPIDGKKHCSVCGEPGHYKQRCPLKDTPASQLEAEIPEPRESGVFERPPPEGVRGGLLLAGYIK